MGEDELHLLLRLLRDVVEVLLVPLRHDDPLDAGAGGGEHLLLDAADREHEPAKRRFAGHRHIPSDPDAGEERGERGEDGDARGGAVLRDRARREVDVDVLLLEEAGIDAELLRLVARVAQRRLAGLLHHVAELAGERDAPLPCILVHSMKSRSPPAAVQARPVATPGSSVRSAVSIQNFSGPRMISRSSGVMVRFALEPLATSTATARQTSAMVRSRLRTPASRV